MVALGSGNAWRVIRYEAGSAASHRSSCAEIANRHVHLAGFALGHGCVMSNSLDLHHQGGHSSLQVDVPPEHALGNTSFNDARYMASPELVAILADFPDRRITPRPQRKLCQDDKQIWLCTQELAYALKFQTQFIAGVGWRLVGMDALEL